MKIHRGRCYVCEGGDRETGDREIGALVSVVMVQMDGKFDPNTVPLCPAHLTQAETVLSDTRTISGQSPPVVINLRAICGNADPGMG